jgi:hypothetical protein
MKNYYAEKNYSGGFRDFSKVPTNEDSPPAQFDGLDGIVTPNRIPVGVSLREYYSNQPQYPVKSGAGKAWFTVFSLILVATGLLTNTVLREQYAADRASSASYPVPGSEEAVIEWMMSYYHFNRSMANLSYDNSVDTFTNMYNHVSPHGRYYGAGGSR